MDSTLAFVAGNSAPGSSIIFDYVDPAILEDSAKHGEVKRMRRMRRVSGEGLVFGIPAGTVESFCNSEALLRSTTPITPFFTTPTSPASTAAGAWPTGMPLQRLMSQVWDTRVELRTMPQLETESFVDIETALKTFRSPDLSKYPELAGYTRRADLR